MAEHSIKIPKNFDYNNFDGFISRVKEIEDLIGLDSHNEVIVFDVTETEYLSAIAVLMIVQTAETFHNCQCLAKCKSKESVPWWKLKVMGAFKEDLQQYLDTSYIVPIQRIFNYDDF